MKVVATPIEEEEEEEEEEEGPLHVSLVVNIIYIVIAETFTGSTSMK